MHNTRRWAREPLELCGRRLAAGDPLWIVLVSPTGRASPAPTFGSGPHAYPGHELATAIAGGVVQVVLDEGLHRQASPAPVTYEPRPNLRIPTRVRVVRP